MVCPSLQHPPRSVVPTRGRGPLRTPRTRPVPPSPQQVGLQVLDLLRERYSKGHRRVVCDCLGGSWQHRDAASSARQPASPPLGPTLLVWVCLRTHTAQNDATLSCATWHDCSSPATSPQTSNPTVGIMRIGGIPAAVMCFGTFIIQLSNGKAAALSPDLTLRFLHLFGEKVPGL